MPRDLGSAFHYGRDVLFLVSSALYLTNRFFIKPHLSGHEYFFHGHFNDCLLVPAALPLFLGTYRALGLRAADIPPTWREVLAHVVLWSFFFEVLGPDWLHRGTADAWDVLCYAAGGLAAWLLWNRRTVANTYFKTSACERNMPQ